VEFSGDLPRPGRLVDFHADHVGPALGTFVRLARIPRALVRHAAMRFRQLGACGRARAQAARGNRRVRRGSNRRDASTARRSHSRAAARRRAGVVRERRRSALRPAAQGWRAPHARAAHRCRRRGVRTCAARAAAGQSARRNPQHGPAPVRRSEPSRRATPAGEPATELNGARVAPCVATPLSGCQPSAPDPQSQLTFNRRRSRQSQRLEPRRHGDPS